MDTLYLLVPMSVLLVLAMIGLFAWALHRGQFDDLALEAERLLQDDEVPLPKRPQLDAHQVAGKPGPEE